MQNLSFEFKNAVLNLAGLEARVFIYTFENAYSLDPASAVYTEGKAICGLLTDGGKVTAEGQASVCWERKGDVLRVKIAVAGMRHRIRSVKLVVRSGTGRAVNLLDRAVREKKDGAIYRYPEGWRTLDVPILFWKETDGTLKYFRSVAGPMSPRTFAVLPCRGGTEVEMIYEPPAVSMTDSICVPEWAIGTTTDAGEVYRAHTEELSSVYGWKNWEERQDVPQWMREVSLIAAIHGRHWTGYVFNDYKGMARVLDWIAERIDGKRVLAYLPGWEGRYYYRYGIYGPDERMGGEKGFRYLCDSAKEKNIELMPMYGMHMASRDLPGFEEWGRTSELMSASGGCFSGSVDWDASRHYDHSVNAQLNPGAPRWKSRLTEQIRRVSETYDLHAVFLDISAMYCNDPRFDVYEGVRDLVHGIRAINGGMLVAGEAWYDRLTDLFPLVQSGHTNGPLNWFDSVDSAHFDTYCRSFAHLLLGDPSRGSTGVHELGYNAVNRVPLRKGIIPTVTIVDGTIENCPEGVETVIGQAKKYAERYL